MLELIKKNKKNIIVAIIILLTIYLLFRNRNIDNFDVGEISTIVSNSGIVGLSESQKKELKDYYTNLLNTTPVIKNLNYADKNLLLAILKNNESYYNVLLSLQLYQNNCTKVNPDNSLKQLVKSENCKEINIDIFKNIHSGSYTDDFNLTEKENNILKVIILDSI